MSSYGSRLGDGPGQGRNMMLGEVPVMLPPGGHRERQLPPQKKIDEFWKKFTTTAPGKATTVLPKNELAERLARRTARKGVVVGTATQASFEEAAAICRSKVEQIVAECRRINQKYRDPHFDLEFDLKTERRDCLESLGNLQDSDSESDASSSSYYPGPPHPRAERQRHRGAGRHRAARRYRRTEGADRRQRLGAIEDGGYESETDGEGGANDSGSDRRKPHGRTPGSKFQPMSVKRVGEIFDEPKFYIDGPTANDVRQGRDGDCWLMAALCTLSNKPGLIEKICVAHNQDVGVYGFVFHRDGEWFSEIIDDKLYLTKPDYDEARVADRLPNMERLLWDDRDRPDSEENYRKTYQSNSGALYFAQCENPNETWLPLLEKAYAKAHGDYAAIEGGFTGEGIEDLTGGVTSSLFTTDILDKEYFWKEELMKVNQQFLFGCSTGLWGRGYGDRKGIMEGHAYSVMRAVEVDGERLLLLKNPWGKGEWKGAWSDGSREWTPEWLQKLGHRFGDDGAFWISYKDLLRKYQAFDRTRLFGPDWKITSKWTTLNVPWTIDYHDTKFSFTLARPGPVVIVLSQLDDRYFRGLEGQYKFALAFRVHKAGEDEYLVRTATTYRMTRSCNVELELEAGEYTVLVKLDARRREWIMPPEDVVRSNARDRREKLLRIGLAYDLAHSKATITETPEEKAAREAYEKRKKDKQRERLRKSLLEAKERDRYRATRAIRARRKQAAWQKEREKQRAEKREAKRMAAEEERRARGQQQGMPHGPLSRSRSRHASRPPRREKDGNGPEQQSAVVVSLEAPEPRTSTDAGEHTPSRSPSTKSVPGAAGKAEDTDSTKENAGEPQAEKSGSDATLLGPPKSGGKITALQAQVAESPPRGDLAPPASPPLDATDSGDGHGKGKAVAERQLAEKPEKRSKSGVPIRLKPAPAEVVSSDESESEPASPRSTKRLERKLKKALGSFEEKIKDLIRAKSDDIDHGRDDGGNEGGPFSGPEDGLGHGNGEPSHQHDEPETEGQGPIHDHGYGHDHYPPSHHPTHQPHHPFHHRHSQQPQATSRDPFGPPPGHIQGPRAPFQGFTGPPGPARRSGPPSYMDARSECSSLNDRDELCSLPSMSDVSETELDYRLKDNEMQMHVIPPRSGPPPQQQYRGQPDDEFEKDPWNAVAVIGLRVYYKIFEREENTDGIVTLRVVRPNPYEMSDDEDEEDEKKGDDKDDKGEGEGENEDQGLDESKVLDVDDSAKDATLNEEAKKNAVEEESKRKSFVMDG